MANWGFQSSDVLSTDYPTFRRQDDIVKYQDNFLRWVDNTSFDENLGGTVFGTDDFICYLNEEVLKNQTEKAYLIETDYVPRSEREKGN